MLRPWKADPYLDDIHQRLVWNKVAMVNVIQHSYVIKGWYQDIQKEDEDPYITVQKDMGMAKHRFDSASKPTGNACLTMRSVNRTANKVWTERRTEVPGQNALAHLTYVSGLDGMERLVQMGMLADASDEGLLFTRFHDKEGSETSLLLAQSTQYLCRIKVLFVDGKALHMGMTKVMLDTIKDVLLWWAPGDVPTRIGDAAGIPADRLHRCVRRMCSFVTLSTLVVETEYPDFDIMAAFGIFALSPTVSQEQ